MKANKNHVAALPDAQEKLDHFIISAVQGLDLFIAQANSQSLGEAARILHTAKEDLVFWAVQKGGHESAEDKFINAMLYHNYLFAVSDFISRLPALLQDETWRELLTKSAPGSPCHSLVHALRRAG